MEKYLELNNELKKRSRELFDQNEDKVARRTDRQFAVLMVVQWLGGIAMAVWLSPYTWYGAIGLTHIHVYAAIYLGGLIAAVPVGFALFRPGRILTRHVIAIGQMMTSALLIHLSGGRIETHFHIFGSLAFLAFYRDWRVIVTATLVVALDHALRGFFWTQSVYGVLTVQPWRFIEHAAWVIFEDIFVLASIHQSLRDSWDISVRQAWLENNERVVEQRVQERTEQLAESNLELSEAQKIAAAARDYSAGIVHNVADLLIVTDRQGRVRTINRAALEILGYGEFDLLGQSANQLFEATAADAGKDALRILSGGNLDLLVQGGSIKDIEINLVNKSREKVPVLLSCSVLKNKDGQLEDLIIVAKDLTERRKLEMMLVQSEKLSAIGQLAAGVAHEINNPLGIILGFAQALMLRIKPNDDISLPVRSIEREAVRCKNLVQNLLTFSRSHAAKMERFDVNEAVRATLNMIEAQARVKAVEVSSLLEPLDLLPGDKNQIQQVIVNLCNNAIDAMPQGGKLIIQTRPSVREGAIGVELEVKDNGAGIPDAIRRKIFNPFFTTKEVGKGTGLGLSLVYEIVQKHNGAIELKTEVGKGTSFIIFLPAQEHASGPKLSSAPLSVPA